ncbi:hypothetical protein CEXT_631591 [Caerostris extrusa]|uniref:Uncharacterized protein n=1 Tax=Caerostris extrusa TaxID=172846 RepID=A0AAV4XM94_CAEEX|nr:hypothetical protein CEXT_631591 [Caerostris extrusa]
MERKPNQQYQARHSVRQDVTRFKASCDISDGRTVYGMCLLKSTFKFRSFLNHISHGAKSGDLVGPKSGVRID